MPRAGGNGKGSGSRNGKRGKNGGAGKGNARDATGARTRARAAKARMTKSAARVRADPTPAARGTLIIIGGREDKEGEKLILRAVAAKVGERGKLVVATVASQVPGELWEAYERVFRGLGVQHVHHLDIESREEAKSERKLRVLDDADVVFFTGGDQLKLTSQLGDSPIYGRLREIYEGGGTIAGTSAGASVVCETMLVSGGHGRSSNIAGDLRMAPGFGLFPDVIIDQHFAERGRIGRLVAAVTQNPRILGIGIDENTAIIHDRHRFRVLGAGAVYVLDAHDLAYTNLTDESGDRTISAFHLRLHLLTMGDEFDLVSREPSPHPAEELEEQLLGTG